MAHILWKEYLASDITFETGKVFAKFRLTELRRVCPSRDSSIKYKVLNTNIYMTGEHKFHIREEKR